MKKTLLVAVMVLFIAGVSAQETLQVAQERLNELVSLTKSEVKETGNDIIDNYTDALYDLTDEVVDNGKDLNTLLENVKSGAITSQFTQGALSATGGSFDFCIDGEGFFQVQLPDGSIGYTRNGALKMAIDTDGITLATSEGYPILDTNGQKITLDATYNSSLLAIDASGNLTYPDDNNNMQSLGMQIGLVQFNNPSGLMKTSSSIFKESAASGTPRLEISDGNLSPSSVLQGYLEGSNVQAADEMVNLIIAQRAYEMNSKAITASDEMLQQANNLRG